MKNIFFIICLALAGSYCANAQGYDPNYKHQAGKTADHSIQYSSFKEQPNVTSDPNYKHNVGKKHHKRDSVTMPSGGTKSDGNYKHQFPSR